MADTYLDTKSWLQAHGYPGESWKTAPASAVQEWQDYKTQWVAANAPTDTTAAADLLKSKKLLSQTEWQKQTGQTDLPPSIANEKYWNEYANPWAAANPDIAVAERTAAQERDQASGTQGVFGAGGGDPWELATDTLTSDMPVAGGMLAGWAQDPQQALRDVAAIGAVGGGLMLLPGAAAGAGTGTAVGGGLTAEQAAGTAALGGGTEASTLAALPAGGMTATGSLSAGEAAMGGVGAAAPVAGAAMPLQAIEGYTAGVGAGEAAAGAAAAGNFDWGKWAESLNNPKSLLDIGSGVQGLVAGAEQKDQATQAQAAANPWGTSGGYELAGQQLQDLMKDPMQVAATDPAYQMRIQGAQRAMGIYGQDSGAMSVAGANASTDWYNQRLQQLGSLAGAGLNPAQAGQIGIQGTQNAITTTGQGLASLGYAAAPQTGAQTTSLR